MIKRVRALAILLCICYTSIVWAQSRNSEYEAYIQKYKATAIQNMKDYRIPASITLAQGLLESGAGKSRLATKANNHFGIKCGSDWRGRTIYHDDDLKGECFRSYKSAHESFEDHGKFLRGKSRYAALFNLSITDYKGWAKGLKSAGYATNPNYAPMLINIIELYQLYQYDKSGGKTNTPVYATAHQVFIANKLYYTRTKRGDTFKALAKEMGVSKRKLIKYNDLYKDYELQDNDILYLQKKHRKALKDHIVHVVRQGESMHSISQMYGIRLKNLYKLNKMKPEDAAPKKGDILRLR